MLLLGDSASDLVSPSVHVERDSEVGTELYRISHGYCDVGETV